MKEVIEALKTERLRRGLTLRDVSERSQIHLSVLRALEQAQFEKVGPAKIVQSLLLEYCTALGVNAELLMDSYRAQQLGDENTERLEQASHGKPAGGKSPKRIFIGCFLGAVSVGVIFSLLWFVGVSNIRTTSESLRSQVLKQERSPISSEEDKTQGAPERSGEPVESLQTTTHGDQTEEPRTSSSSETSHPGGITASLMPSPNSTEDILPSGQPTVNADSAAAVAKEQTTHHLEIQADQKSWIQVTVDGKEPESDLLQPGERREWRAKASMRVILGNGGGVRMKWDGKPVEITSKPNRVIRLTLPDAILGRK